MPTAEIASESPQATLSRLWYDRPPLSVRGSDRPRRRRDLNRPVLLAALSAEAVNLHDHVAAAGDEIDWDWLLDRARAHKVTGLMLTVLDDAGLMQAVPERLLPVCQQLQEVAVDRIRRAAQTLAEVLDAFDGQSIRCLLIKGPLLAEHVYRNPLRRPYSDIDLVVQPHDLGRAEAVLIELGYAYASSLPESHLLNSEGSRAHERAHRHAFTYRRRGRLTVDLHWSLTSPKVLRMQPDDIWEYATDTTVSGRHTECLEPAAATAHLAVHALIKAPLSGFQLLHMCDLVWMLERVGSEIDADRLWHITRKWRAQRFVYLAITIAAKMCPAAVDRRFLDTAPLTARLGVSPGTSNERLVDQVRTRLRGVHLLQLMLTQARWEVATGRRPHAAAETVKNTLCGFASFTRCR